MDRWAGRRGSSGERSALRVAARPGLPELGVPSEEISGAGDGAAVRARSLRPIWTGAWSRRTWTPGVCVRLLLSLVALSVCSWLGIILSHQSEGVATIWLSNGILFGLVITRPREQWMGYFLAGLTADTFADVFYGDPFRVAIGVSLANSAEVVTASLALTRWFGAPLNLSKRRPLIGFLLAAVLGAATLSSSLGATWTMHVYGGGQWWQMFRTWYLGDMLGMALLAPLVFMLQRPGFFSILHRRQLPHTLLVLLLPAAVSVLVFTHRGDPLIFFLFPALLLVVFRLGFPGTVVTIFVVAFVAIGLTVKGHGPLMLIPGEHMMLHRLVVAQIFLAVAIFTTFPVAALLEERAVLQSSLAESEARHRRLANADDLTGLFNRRAFNVRLEEEWQRAAEAREPVGLLLIDADFFKIYNDVHGHLRGDECLRCIAEAIARTVEGGSRTAARFGGEEFAVILPRERTGEAEQMAERVRRAILDLKLPHGACPGGVQTVSVGVAAVVPERGQPVTSLINGADRALYQAKDRGRNRVEVA